MIVYKKGDIFESNEKYIAHGCNCSGGFGSGVARIIATRYPNVREAYLHKYNSTGWRLGDTDVVICDMSGRQIANCATQERYSKPADGPYVSYPAIRKVIKSLVQRWPEGFAIPKIGAGFAGGNWDIISEIINEISEIINEISEIINEESGDTEVRVYVL